MTEQPKIELRKISLSKSLSEETPAYTAQVWVDGKHFLNVSNHGQGGCDMQYPAKGKTNADVQALNDKIKATYPKWGSEFGDGDEYETDLESLCHTLIGRWEVEKEVKRDLAKKIMFIKPSDGKLYSVKFPPNPAQNDQLVAIVKKTHGLERVLNEMPLAEVIAAYEKVGA